MHINRLNIKYLTARWRISQLEVKKINQLNTIINTKYNKYVNTNDNKVNAKHIHFHKLSISTCKRQELVYEHLNEPIQRTTA